ncbi:antibiotic biosynthesis monooxygenase [Jeongeupia naejangsanensis]|uniref:Antibiotic biosynthesis monooxygenase n=1 Tax=Jeongeupia naejangsanensis TaxID=613195 RepID=A0ABS2BLT5_9NEIS|nr:antibiotic biosynthesis monooxygenase [Jeongeupia naejangsanensis]MBM3116582.1 antibiotic biosynthesis monooxygenase [Jeongeupia naejangsanensis]
MYSSTFIFEKKQYDAEFERLDPLIAAAARAHPDFAGEEHWENPHNGRLCVVYYWHSLAGLHALMRDPQHVEAKRQYQRWYKGFQIVIAEVVRAYGDGHFADHPVAAFRAAEPA